MYMSKYWDGVGWCDATDGNGGGGDKRDGDGVDVESTEEHVEAAGGTAEPDILFVKSQHRCSCLILSRTLAQLRVGVVGELLCGHFWIFLRIKVEYRLKREGSAGEWRKGKNGKGEWARDSPFEMFCARRGNFLRRSMFFRATVVI